MTSIKKIHTYSVLIFFTLFSYAAQAQMISLQKEWKFKQGDNIDWASPSFNDSDWDTKLSGTSWSAKDVKGDVFAWYRIKFVIPSSIKAAAEHGHGIKFNLGKIDDVDFTYFNGKLIGQTGSIPPQYITKWDADRVYTISEKDVLWDKENVLVVRVFSPDIGGIGMYEGQYNYGAIQWSDFISIEKTISETAYNGFTTALKFKNKGTNAFDGTVKYWVKNKANKELFSETKPIQVKAENGFETTVTLSNYQPKDEQIFKVGYEITENNSPAKVENEQVYLANSQINIKVNEEPKPQINNKIQDAYTSIPFQNQTLNGYLGKRFTQNLEERLLKVDEKGLIDGYLQRPGSHPWIGEHVGKYLESACNVWRNTHDARLKKQMDRLAFELINTQLEDGYLGTYIPNNYWTSWDVWSHKYNLYGLLAYYTTTGYKPALETCKKIGDLLCLTFGNKTGQLDIIAAGTHIGMASTSVLDPMIELYKYTGDKKYLDFCYYILESWEQKNGPKIISSLLKTGQVNKVANGKAYEMLSNLVGLTKLYRLTGDEKLLKPVQIAWQDVVEKRLYITGSTSSHEHFQDDDNLPAANKDNIGEGCVTTTWIQLNHQLLAISGELKYLDQIEKSIYNHLLGAENPIDGCVSYYTSLMDKKPYTCGISCCTSSVPRGIAMMPYYTFGNVKNVPTIMLYEAANYKGNITINKQNVDFSLKTETDFPENGEATITVNTSKTADFPLALRVPSWCISFVAKIENKEFKGSPNTYLTIKRTWKTGDKIKISFQMPIQTLAGGKSYPNQLAFQRGPQVLAFDEALNSELLKETIQITQPNGINNAALLPKQWIGKQAYSIQNVDKNRQKIIIVPYADASQTGGVVKVWLPLNIIKK
jgi:DUF1680 family protein